METNNLPDKQTLQIWIDGLADTLQYLILTDSQGHEEECRNVCTTVAGVRELMQDILEAIQADNVEYKISRNEKET